VVQEVECLPSRYKALSSNSSTGKKEKRETEKEGRKEGRKGRREGGREGGSKEGRKEGNTPVIEIKTYQLCQGTTKCSTGVF
jgi:hypothetical protein